MSTSEISSNVHDHGTAVDEQKRRVKCNYCAKEMSGFTRLKYHLGRVRGDVAPCDKVPSDVRELMEKSLLKAKKGNLNKEVGKLYYPDLPWKRNWSPESSKVKHIKLETTKSTVSGSEMGKRMTVESVDCISETNVSEKKLFPNRRVDSCTTVKSEKHKEDLSRHTQRCIARFFYENGISFSAANSPSFQRLIDAVVSHGRSGLMSPSHQELKGLMLQEEVEEMNQYVKEVRHSWQNTGCSILLDGWTNEKGRSLINFLVDCPRGPVFLRSTDVSDSIGDVHSLQLLLDEVIEEVGVQNVVQVVTYSTSVCMEDVGRQLMEKYKTIFWTVCASYCISLILEKIGMMGPIKRVLNKAKIITRFIYSHSIVLKLMRKHIHGRDIVRTSRIRSATQFLTLENLLTERENLMNMFTSSEWNGLIWSSRTEGTRVADLVQEPSFWSEARMVLKATIPLVRVLCLIDGDQAKPQMGYIYETMDQAKETIKREFKDKRSKYLPFWETIDGIWDNHLHSPLHSAGYFLNPSLFYSSDFFADAEVASGLLCCIVRMVEDRKIQDLISLQIDEYRAAKGSFGQGSAIDERTTIPPAQWWETYGGHCPELQRLAIRILSQTCIGASRYKLKRNLPEQLHTNGRNFIEQKRLNDLIFVHYNLHLQQFLSQSNDGMSNIMLEEIDPFDDWIVEEAQDISHQNDDTSWMDTDCGETTIANGFVNEEGVQNSN